MTATRAPRAARGRVPLDQRGFDFSRPDDIVCGVDEAGAARSRARWSPPR
jgi:ribonuclease HII